MSKQTIAGLIRPGRAHICAAAFTLLLAFAQAAPSLIAQTNAAFTGAQSVVPIGSGVSPSGVAVDASGNLYIVDSANSQVVKAGWSSGAFSTSVVANAAANGLKSPAGVAVDTSGNVYISDTGNNRILKETLSSGSYTQSVVLGTGALTVSSPQGLAVDSSGNVYVADNGNARIVKLTLSSGAYSASAIVSSLLGPRGVAVDSAANLYIADVNSGATNSQALKETLKSGSYTQSTVANHAANGLSDPVGVSVDSAGNVYIADTGLDEVLKETLSGTSYTQSVLAGKSANGISVPSGIAADWTGSVYIADSGNADLLKVQWPAANFGMVPDASTSWSDQITFTFSASETLNSPSPDSVVAMGATGQEFVDTQTGTCTAGKSYTGGETCTVIVTFSPVYSGTRNGAVILQDSNANTIATALLSGVGAGPQMIHFGGFEQITATHIGQVSDVAVDSAGEVYMVDEGGGLDNSSPQPYKLNPATNIKLPLGGTSWSLPVGIALDGAGNIYVSDYDVPAVYEIPAGDFTTRTTVPVTVKGPIGLAVDAAGNLFVADAGAGAVYKMTPAGTVSSLGSNWVQPNRLAVDSAGNLYVSDYGNGTISEITPAGVKSTLTESIGSPFGVAVDPSGTIYVASGAATGGVSLDQTVYELTPSGKVTALVTQTDGAYPQGVALDTKGNVYIADSNAQLDLPSALIYELDRADPLLSPLNFPTATNVQTQDTADGDQTVTFQNIGNQTLEYATNAGNNPSYPASFPENSADANLCASATPLAAGAACDVSMYFEPQLAGAISDAVVLTDNSLNQSGATQSIAVTGTGIGKTQTITFSPIAGPVAYGVSPITLSASATSGLAIVFSIVSGPGAVTGNQLTVTGVGAIVVAANQPGGGIYAAAAQQTQSVTVNIGSQTISFTAPASPVNYGVAPIALSATASSGLPVTFSVLSGPGSVTSGMLTVTGVGTITIAANQAGNSDYNAAAQMTQSVTVNQASQTIGFTPMASPVTYGVKPIGLSATATSGLAVAFTVSGPASLSGSTLTITGAGTVNVTASQAGNADYTAAPEVEQSITVNKAAQTISFTAPPATVDYGVKPIPLKATATSGLPVAFTVTGPAKVSGGTLTFTGVGAVVVTANQTGSANYLAAAQIPHDITVKKGAQTITYTKQPPSSVTYGVKPITLEATATSGLKVALSVLSGPAKISGDTLTVIGYGTVSLAANQAGNADWSAAPEIKKEIVVKPANLTVTAQPLTIDAGASKPKSFPYTMTGFVPGDTAKNSTTGTPDFTTNATFPAVKGTYTITVNSGTLKSTKYAFVFAPGKLTVN